MKQYRDYIVLGVATLLLMGVGYYAVSFFLDQLNRQTERMYQSIADYRWDEQRVETLSGLRERASEIAQSRSLFDEALLRKGGEVAYITYLENIASASGVDMKIVASRSNSPGVESEEEAGENDSGGGLEPFDLRVGVEGSYDAVYKFLKRVEIAPTIIHIVSLDLTWDQGGREENIRLSQESAVLNVNSQDGQLEVAEVPVQDEQKLKGQLVLRAFFSKSDDQQENTIEKQDV